MYIDLRGAIIETTLAQAIEFLEEHNLIDEFKNKKLYPENKKYIEEEFNV